ncbi:MAG: LapA family protein [Desulfotomaculaceae bacterium]|nr:LapA family protein [Desulfotomaculaceae bacterium]
MSKAQTYFILALLFALSVAIFAIQNTESVSINFLFWQYPGISKVLVILSSAAVGAVMVMFLGFWWQFKKAIYIRQLEAEIKILKNQQSQQTAAGTVEPKGQETTKKQLDT